MKQLPSSLPLNFVDGGRWLVGLTKKDTFSIWNCKDATVLREHNIQACFDLCVAEQTSRAAIAAGESWSGAVIGVWSIMEMEKVCEISFMERLRRMAFSSDGKRIAAIVGHWTEDTRVELFDALTGERIRKLPADEREKGWCLSLAFSPDGSMLATGGGYRGIRLWDAVTGQILKFIDTEAGNPELRFSTDGTHLILQPEDCGMMAYEIATGKCIEAIYGVSFIEMRLRHSCISGLGVTRSKIGDLHIVRYPGREVVGWLPGGLSFIQIDQQSWRYLAGVCSEGIGLFRLHGHFGLG